MDPGSAPPPLRSLEERVRQAHAERSMEIGYAIGDALAAAWRVLSALPFSPSARRKLARSRPRIVAQR